MVVLTRGGATAHIYLEGSSLKPPPGTHYASCLWGHQSRGVGSSDNTGYRKPLLEALQLNGINARMVGSRKDGSMQNNDHEGWRGFRIDEIEKKAKTSACKLSPDFVLINAGSNDCLQSFEIPEIGRRLGRLVDHLSAMLPQSTIILSTLVGSANKVINSAVLTSNEQIRALAEMEARKQRKIVLVDMHTDEGPDILSLVDGIHPDDEGYKRMARVWLRGIQEAVQKGFINVSR